MFQVPHKTIHGTTLYADDPKLAAYRYAAWCQKSGHAPTSMTFHADGAVTVTAPGIEPTTYEREPDESHDPNDRDGDGR